jgi:hypothetical protein
MPRSTKKSVSKSCPNPAAKEKKSTKTKKAVTNAKLSALDAAAKVLSESNESLTCPQLIEVMTQQGLWSSAKGKTPANTLNAAIHKEMATKGDASRFVQAERGKFSAKPKA